MDRPDLARLRAEFPWPVTKPAVKSDWGLRWFSDDETRGHLRFFKMLIPTQPRTIVELGSFLGRSAAGWLKIFPEAHVIAIDSWLESFVLKTTPPLPGLLPLPTFQVNLWDQQSRVTAIRKTSVEGLQTLHDFQVTPDVIYVDADHSVEAVIADVSQCLDLFPKARLIGDDWNRPSVQAGMARVSAERGFRFAACRNVWWIPWENDEPSHIPSASPEDSPEKVVTLTLYRRADYTQRVLNALAACDGIGDYHVIMHLEPGHPDVLRVAQAATFARKTIVENEDRLGCAVNTLCALDHGFQHADFVIHLEDDTVPARDCLRYFEWAGRTYRDDPQVFSISAYSRGQPPAEQWDEVERTPWFTPWGWATWRDRWREVAPQWRARGWGTLMNELRGQRIEIRPLLARCQNIGAERGEHCPNPEFHRQEHFNEFGAWSVETGRIESFRET